MQNKVMTDIQDLTYLNWSHARNSSGTAGTFLKSQSISDGKKIYYKLSNFDSEKGIIGHECVNGICPILQKHSLLKKACTQQGAAPANSMNYTM